MSFVSRTEAPLVSEQAPESHALKEDDEQRGPGDDGQDQVVVPEVGIQTQDLRPGHRQACGARTEHELAVVEHDLQDQAECERGERQEDSR